MFCPLLLCETCPVKSSIYAFYIISPSTGTPTTCAASTSAPIDPEDGRDLLDDPPSQDASGQEASGPATLLRSLLTDKGPTPPVTQASSSESGTSSVDLGLITLAMLAVKSASKSNEEDAANQEKVG